MIKGGGHILLTTKDKAVGDQGIHIDSEEIGTEYYIQKLFNKTWTWQIIKSVTEIKFVTMYLTRFFRKKKFVFSEKKSETLFWGGAKSLLKGRGCRAMKMNVTFF